MVARPEHASLDAAIEAMEHVRRWLAEPKGAATPVFTAKLEEALEEALEEHARAKNQFCDFLYRAGDPVPDRPK